jgi:hypothetical protein
LSIRDYKLSLSVDDDAVEGVNDGLVLVSEGLLEVSDVSEGLSGSLG